jgi:hypothetical protein
MRKGGIFGGLFLEVMAVQNFLTYQVHAGFSIEFSGSYSQDSEFMDLFHAFAPAGLDSRTTFSGNNVWEIISL